MPSTGSLHVGQVDPQTYFVYVTQAGALASFDFTTVSSASIRVKKPSGATQTWTGAISNQTTAGLTFTRTLQTGDLDEAGSYTGYLLMVVAGGTLRSEAEEFFVAEEFAIVADEDTPSWFIAGAVISGGGGTVPTGTGVPHIVGGVQNAAASLIVNADVDAAAAIAVSKLAAGTNSYVLTTTAGVPVWAAPSGGSVPTGTGFTHITAGAQDAASKLVENADVHASAAISVSKLAAGTNTHVLTTTGGVPTWSAPAAPTAPSGSGFYTITAGVADAAASSAAAGVLTFLATPSSANLRTMLTDESGTGEAIFSTSPTFKTGILLNNPANTFAYTFTPAAIAAARTITLPLLTSGDTMVTEAFTQTLTNKTINGSNNTITNVAISTAVSGLGAGVATFLGTPSSANLATAVTDETGSGALMFGTAPTVKTTLTIRNPADTFSYTITPAAIAATRTFTLPLLTGNDTFVAEAHTQTLTNKTISGASNTITNVPISTGISGLGAGVATWLATPSSANLATAVTDETGTGALVFGTAPTFKTTVTVRNPADTFSYTITPSAIAATRVLTLPLLTGDDTVVTQAHAQTLTNKTIASGSNTITGIANTNVDAAAAIAGTKIDPDFGSQLVQTGGNMLATQILATDYFHTSGSPSPTTGNIRLENTHKIVTRNNANSANACIAQYGSGDVLYVGLNSAYGEQAYGTVVNASSYTWLAVNGNFIIRCSSTEAQMVQPVVGDGTYSSPYACHGAVVSAMTDANYTVPASEYKFYTIAFVCTGGTTRTATFPHPSSLDRSYTKNIRGSSEKILTISTGTGTTVNLAAAKCRVFEFTNGGVRVVGPEYDP